MPTELQPILPTKMIEVNTSNLCNLKCVTCVRNWEEYKQPSPHYLSLVEFSLILSRFTNLNTVQFCGFSEPTLNKDLPDMIETAKKSGIGHVEMFTNGTKLVGDMANRIAQSGLNLLRISIDGGDSATYRKSRGTDLDKILRNVFAFSSNSGRPVRVESVLSQMTATTAYKLPEVAEAAGAKYLSIRLLDGQDAHVDKNSYANPAKLQELKQQLITSCDERGINLVMPLPGENGSPQRCMAWEEVYVNEHGELVPCYLSQGRKAGSLLTHTLEEIQQMSSMEEGDFFKDCNCAWSLMTHGIIGSI